MNLTQTITLEHNSMQFSASACGDEGAPVVLLLHGFPQTRHTYRRELPALASAGFRAVAPDQRGYSPGARPLGIESYATELLVEDVLGFIAALGGAPVHLVGHDWGGQLAWLTAAHHPDSLRSLSVLSRPHPAAFARALGSDSKQAERSRHHRGFRDPKTADFLLEEDGRRLRAMLVSSGVPVPDADAYLQTLNDRDALDACLHWYRAAGSKALGGADCPPVTVPTLYLWGDCDQSVGRPAAELTQEYVEAPYRFVAIEAAGHFLTDDGAGEQVTRELLKHIEGHAQG